MMEEKRTAGTASTRAAVREYLASLKRYRGFIVVFVATSVLCSLLITYVTSEKYLATTTIFYQPIETSLLRGRDTEAFGAPVPTAPFKIIHQTLNDAIRNEVVLRPVVRDLEMDKEIPRTYASWYRRIFGEVSSMVKDAMADLWMVLKYGRIIEVDPEAEAIVELAKNTEVAATKESYIYRLKVKDKYPERSAMIVDKVGQYLVQWLLFEYKSPSQERLLQLEKQVKEKEEQIADLRERRKRILEDNSYVSLAQETEKGLDNLYQMELEEIRISAEIEKREQEISEYEVALSKRSPDMQIEDYRRMKSDLAMGKVDLAGLVAQRDYLRSSIVAAKAHLNKLPMLERTINEIDMNIASSTRDLDHLSDLYTETLTRLNTERTEARVMHRAAVPYKPVQPIKVYHVGLTAFLSLMISVGLASVLTYFGVGQAEDRGTPLTARLGPGQADAFLRAFATKMKARGGSLFALEPDQLVLLSSLDRDHVPAVIPKPLPDDTVLEEVTSEENPVLIEDFSRTPETVKSGWDGYEGRSSLAFPVVEPESGRTVAVVTLHGRADEPFTERDKRKGTELLAAYRSKLGLPAEKRGLSAALRYVLLVVSAGLLAGVIYYLLKKVGV